MNPRDLKTTQPARPVYWTEAEARPAPQPEPAPPAADSGWRMLPVVCARCGVPLEDQLKERRFLQCPTCHASFGLRLKEGMLYHLKEFDEIAAQAGSRAQFLEADSRLRNYLPGDLSAAHSRVRSSRQVLQELRAEYDRLLQEGTQTRQDLLMVMFGGVLVMSIFFLLMFSNAGGLWPAWFLLGAGCFLGTIFTRQYRNFRDDQLDRRLEKKKDWMRQAYWNYMAHIAEVKDLDLEADLCNRIVSRYRIQYD